MGKAGFYLYGARGKVGNLVARKGPKGGTVLAARQTQVKNPQTNKQMAQRIILATVAAAAKGLYEIIDHSFEGYAKGSASTQRFRKVNMNKLRQLAAVDFADTPKAVDAQVFMTTKNVKALVPNQYIISEGSLAPTKIKIEKIASEVMTTGKDFNCVFGNVNITATEIDGKKFVKLGDLISQIFGLNQVGQQLTFVGIEKTGDGVKFAFNNEPDTPGWMIPYTGMFARRLFLSPNVDLDELVPLEAPFTIGDDMEESILWSVKNAFKNERTDDALLEYIFSAMDNGTYALNDGVLTITDIQDNYTAFNASDDDLGYLYAFGIIRSRVDGNGNWVYSNTSLQISVPTTEKESNFGLDWNSAILAWFEGSVVAENNEFLQAGGEENVLGESFQ